MLFLVLKEILSVRGIEQPYGYLGQEFRYITNFAGCAGVQTKISTIRKVAKTMDLPPYFIARMFKLGRIEDERFI